jgi:uncharacterized Fe-S radical SAM superfamily protein PflX
MSAPQLKDYKYDNIEQVKTQAGGKIVRKVSIKNGKGYKSISRYHKRKHAGTIKKNLKTAEIQMIKLGKFIPGLFNNCKTCSKRTNNKTRTRKH